MEGRLKCRQCCYDIADIGRVFEHDRSATDLPGPVIRVSSAASSPALPAVPAPLTLAPSTETPGDHPSDTVVRLLPQHMD